MSRHNAGVRPHTGRELEKDLLTQCMILGPVRPHSGARVGAPLYYLVAYGKLFAPHTEGRELKCL